MDIKEYITIKVSMIPKEFMDKYNLNDKVHNGYIFVWVTKGVYVLPQVGRIAHDAFSNTWQFMDTIP